MTALMPIRLKSAYADPEPGDGLRILVDRLWPRGLSKEQLQLDAWMKDLAPSDELRRWFSHDPVKWNEFRSRYCAELAVREEAVVELLEWSGERMVTLVFAARDRRHNNAVALRDYLEERTARTARPGKERS